MKESAPQDPKPHKGRIQDFIDKGQPLTGLAGIILTVASLLWAATVWVDSRVEKAVLDEGYLRTLAARVRPSCIVNTRNTVELQHGAEDYIDTVVVTPSPGVNGYDLLIKAKRHLAYAPLVTALNVSLHPQVTERQDGHNWKITMTPQLTYSPLTTDNGGFNTNVVHRFLVEVLH
jgi:hypothetical protein